MGALPLEAFHYEHRWYRPALRCSDWYYIVSETVIEIETLDVYIDEFGYQSVR